MLVQLFSSSSNDPWSLDVSVAANEQIDPTPNSNSTTVKWRDLYILLYYDIIMDRHRTRLVCIMYIEIIKLKLRGGFGVTSKWRTQYWGPNKKTKWTEKIPFYKRSNVTAEIAMQNFLEEIPIRIQIFLEKPYKTLSI